jgi:hypothetical protein
MQDQSHKALFVGISALMCAVCLYGSEAVRALLEPDDGTPMVSTPGMRDFKPAGDAVLAMDQGSTRNARSDIRKDTSPSTATVLPNGSSCPAANLGTAVSPAAQGPAIAPAPGIAPPSPPLQTGSAVGTGSSCPPQRNDARVVPPTPVPGKTSNPLAANAPPGASPPVGRP